MGDYFHVWSSQKAADPEKYILLLLPIPIIGVMIWIGYNKLTAKQESTTASTSPLTNQ